MHAKLKKNLLFCSVALYGLGGGIIAVMRSGWRIKTVGVVYVCTFVGSCLATKVFIGNLPAMRRGWVIIK